MATRFKLLLVVFLASALLTATGCKTPKQDDLSVGLDLVKESRKAPDLKAALQKLEAAVEKFAGVQEKHTALHEKLPPEVAEAQEDLPGLRLSVKRGRQVMILGETREFAKARKLLGKLVDETPKRYRRVAATEAGSLNRKIMSETDAISRWRSLTERIEPAFKAKTEYRYWSDISKCFPPARGAEVFDGYRKGYDSATRQPSAYKVGWIAAAATRGTPEEVIGYFRDVRRPDERARANLFVAQLYEHRGDFRAAAEMYRRVEADLLPAEVASIVLRRVRFYDLMEQRRPESEAVMQMVRLVDASRLTIDVLKFAGSRRSPDLKAETRLFPRSAQAAADHVRGRFIAWLGEDWGLKYRNKIELVYRSKGVYNSIPARSPRERKALEPVFKFTYYMLWKVNKKVVDLDNQAMASEFAWFRQFMRGVRPDTSPSARAREFETLVSNTFGRELPYFQYARKGNWKAAIDSLATVKRPAR